MTGLTFKEIYFISIAIQAGLAVIIFYQHKTLSRLTDVLSKLVDVVTNAKQQPRP